MEENVMYKKRIVYLDLLRIIAGILVVMVHVSALQIESLQVDSMQYVITNAFNCLSFSGVALFVMISGALALNPDKETGLKSMLMHKTVRFFALYYIWKVFYQVVIILENGERFTPANIKKDILLALVQQRGYYHLWFLPMIAILYMIVPLVKKGVADKNVCRYFLCVFFVTAILFPTLFNYEFKFKYLFVDFFESNDFYMFGGYLGYFILGHYLHRWCADISTKKRTLLYIAGGCGFVLGCILGTIASRKAGEPSYIMNTPFAVTTFFTAAAIYIAVQSLCRKVENTERMEKVLQSCADRVFGIYLLHPLVINLFCMIGFDTSVCTLALSIPLMIACVFGVSCFFSLLLSKIPIISKLIR